MLFYRRDARSVSCRFHHTSICAAVFPESLVAGLVRTRCCDAACFSSALSDRAPEPSLFPVRTPKMLPRPLHQRARSPSAEVYGDHGHENAVVFPVQEGRGDTTLFRTQALHYPTDKLARKCSSDFPFVQESSAAHHAASPARSEFESSFRSLLMRIALPVAVAPQLSCPFLAVFPKASRLAGQRGTQSPRMHTALRENRPDRESVSVNSR